MADLERERPFLQALLPGGIALPALDADGEQIIIRAHSSQNIIEERLQLIAMVCLLAVLTRGQLPLLLLDRFDRGLSAEETVDLAAGLQQLGRHCQLIISTESELLASADGWQKVQLVGPEGLAGGGSVTEKQDLTANAGEQGQKLVQK
jgi:predicted ATPase